MKRKTGWILLLLACLLACGTAMAQTLPSNEVFSPGLVKLAALEKTQPSVWAQASIQADKAMYARDLSVLSGMLSGTTLTYQSGAQGETLSIERGGETLGVYAVPSSAPMDALADRLLGTAVLERVPLATIADWLEGLRAGDALGLGLAVSEPFTLARTMSDDGTRLTKIVVSGAIVREGEAAYRVEGFLYQPAGRSPKDSLELTFTQDADNALTLVYSALRQNEVTSKNRAGTASVRTTLRLSGKLAGSAVSSSLTVTMKNRWTADGDALNERVSITATLTHRDNTPGRRLQRLNSVDATTKNTIRLTTHESGDETLALSDAMEIDVKLDSNTFLAGSAEMTVRVGGEAQPLAMEPEDITQEAVRRLARRIYPLLDKHTQEAIRKGL